MKILVLGGTVFLGRAFVESALSRGHEVTLLHRGRHNPDLFPNVERIVTDRLQDVSALRGRRWDAVVDPSAYVPRAVRAVVDALTEPPDHYTFVSSISVYANPGIPNQDETAAVGTIEDPSTEEITGETYGPLKVLCEREAESGFPGRVLTVRPGLIVGPNDPTDRFTYWVERVARGGEVLAPGRPDRAIQIIDVRDLAEWMLRLAEGRRTGVFNATGPDRTLTLGDLLTTAERVSGSSATVTWVSEEFIAEQKVAPWSELPVWVPEAGEDAGVFAADCRKAFAAGLTFRPIEATVRDTLTYATSLPADRQRRAGLEAEREKELLRLWHQRASG